MAPPLLVMLAKAPRPGRVKTRLTGPGGLTAGEAAALAEAVLRDVTAALWRPQAWRLRLVHPADESGAELAALAPAGTEIRAQPAGGEGDFGALLEGLFRDGCGPPDPRLVVVGGDVPLLTAERCEAAFAALRSAELVLGPDHGGGCYLIGCRRALSLFGPEAPEGPIAWSAGTDFAELTRRADGRGLRWSELPVEADLDQPADLERLRRALEPGRIEPTRLPEVRAVMGRVRARGP